jgi:hypothetical protein
MRKPVPTGWGQRLSCSGTRSLYRRPFCCSSSSICFASSTTALPLINPSVPMVLKIAANIKIWWRGWMTAAIATCQRLAPAASGAPGSLFLRPANRKKAPASLNPRSNNPRAPRGGQRASWRKAASWRPGVRLSCRAAELRTAAAQQAKAAASTCRPPREGAPKGFEPRAD